jgi:hypothetical protein
MSIDSDATQPTMPPTDGPKRPIPGVPLSGASAVCVTSLKSHQIAFYVRHEVAYLMVSTVLGTLLIPFLVGVFYFSTKKQRRTPMFIFVVLSIVLTIGQAVLYIVIEVQF